MIIENVHRVELTTHVRNVGTIRRVVHVWDAPDEVEAIRTAHAWCWAAGVNTDGWSAEVTVVPAIVSRECVETAWGQPLPCES